MIGLGKDPGIKRKKKISDSYIFKKPFSVRKKPRDTNFSFASKRN